MSIEGQRRIQIEVIEQWRRFIISNAPEGTEQANPILFGLYIRSKLEEFKDEIKADVADAIEASEMRRSWQR